MVKEKIFESFALIISTVLTITIAIGLIRYYAPHLLGLSSDVQLVKTSKKVPPFFEGVFRASDYGSDQYIIPDPYIKRAKPLFPDIGGLGPNDLLGFRNRSVPNVADIIIIGDSQTYGNNANLETNWPNLFIDNLNKKNSSHITHYDLAVGGWGSIEYLEIFYKALFFQPKTVIVAFYTGNDPLESFRLAYSNERWAHYQTDDSLSLGDLPYVEFPSPIEELWGVVFKDGVETVFTPKNRLYSNKKNKVAKAGYDAMLKVATEIASVCINKKITPVFAIIPTKELVYRDKIYSEVTDVPEEYNELVVNEQEYIDWLESQLLQISGAQYINVVKVLQEKALLPVSLYPSDGNGHPTAAGYKVIADELAKEFVMGWEIPKGLVALFTSESSYQLGLIRNDSFWQFSNTEIIEANGWSSDTTPMTIKPRDIANLKKRGLITTVDREKFGPL